LRLTIARGQRFQNRAGRGREFAQSFLAVWRRAAGACPSQVGSAWGAFGASSVNRRMGRFGEQPPLSAMGRGHALPTKPKESKARWALAGSLW